ncbi:MAG TPA: SapC family protein [Alphaproteobacteria bacterium]|nr:SapC family protein [Alphaproteobacteria bacterium]
MTQTAALPLFYRRPAPLDTRRHAGGGLAAVDDVRFAAKANAVPLAAPEFFRAQVDMPIVFTTGAQPTAHAVLGLVEDENLFVGEDGRWLAGAYVPAYVRRYPFIFFQPQQADGRLVLCLDEAAEQYTQSGGRPLFADGQPSELTQTALKFCADYQTQIGATAPFVAALAEKGLLVENQAEAALAKGGSFRLGGFQVVDEAKLADLDADTVVDWHRKGWLALIHAHLMSMGRWQNLVDLKAKRA